MRKKIIAAIAILMLACSSAQAVPSMYYDSSNGHKVTDSGMTDGDEVSLFVVKHGANLATINPKTEILYIDETTVSGGVAEFSFKLKVSEPVDIYSGYTSMAKGSQPLKFTATVVTFKNSDGTDVIKVMGTDSSRKLHSLPSIPSKEGYLPDGWKSGDSELTKDTTVNVDMTVLATYKIDDGPAFTVGDIDGDGNVDIDDATYLFGYSMIPEYYPMSYSGKIDYTDDGNIDIQDAIYLFNYSMVPEAYPITKY